METENRHPAVSSEDKQWRVFMISAGILALIYVLLLVLRRNLTLSSGNVQPLGRLTIEATADLYKTISTILTALPPLLLEGMAVLVLVAAMRFSFKRAGILWGAYALFRILVLIWAQSYTYETAMFFGITAVGCLAFLLEALLLLVLPMLFGRSMQEMIRFLLYTTIYAVWNVVVSSIDGCIVATKMGYPYMPNGKIPLSEIVLASMESAARTFVLMLIIYGLILLIQWIKSRKHVETIKSDL